MLKFNEPEPESYASKRISEEEASEVLRLWETEQRIEQEKRDKEAAMPTVHDVAETLRIPEEDVARLLEKVRNDKLPDPPELPAEPLIEVATAPVKRSDNPPLYINSQSDQLSSDVELSATSNDNPLEIQGVVTEESSALETTGKSLMTVAILISIIVSLAYLIGTPRQSTLISQQNPTQYFSNGQPYTVIDGHIVPYSNNPGYSTSSTEYSSTVSRSTLSSANDAKLQKAILSQNKSQITRVLSSIVSTESNFAPWSVQYHPASGSASSQQYSDQTTTKAVRYREFSSDNTTPIQYAQAHNRKKSFMYLVQAGADINQITEKTYNTSSDAFATTPLIDAVTHNNAEWCRFLLDNDALLYVPELNSISINTITNGITNTIHPKQALEIAAEQGKAEICRILLEHEDLENEDNILSFEKARALAIKHRKRSVVELFHQRENELLSRSHPAE